MMLGLMRMRVFLTVHDVDREDAAGQAERFDQSLDGWDLVRLLLDDFMSQDDPMIDGESAQHMRRLSVGEGIKAARGCPGRRLTEGQARVDGGQNTERRSKDSALGTQAGLPCKP